MKKFKIYLEYDPEYEGFIADAPTLPGCMSQGKTEEEALKNIQEAISGYLKVIKKHHKIVPSEEIRYVTVGV
ncbi:MAG: type II toxin-antitoxin system HicB family antitoxin [Patescibacteria group bacterium]|nr:type II toxin-antitoxin system HicB family antitoxin [Patescibacteria group bacterium]